MVTKVEFWQQRWRDNQTGFHEGEVNAYLEKNITELSLTKNDTLFLPLCGKAYDLIWLSERGYHVIGVECSELAVSAFFAENNLSANVSEQGQFKVWQSGNITLYCGDFYNLEASWLTAVTAIFDRAALVAIEQQAREHYMQKIIQLCPQAKILLVSLDYPQNEMSGPPFAVTQDEIQTLVESYYALKRIENNDILAENDKFKERGLTQLNEKVFLISPK